MRGLAILIGALVVILCTTEVTAAKQIIGRKPAATAKFTCKIVTGYGTAIGRGNSKLEAKQNARELCGSKIIDDYFAKRGKVNDDVVDDLALACVNLECQQ